MTVKSYIKAAVVAAVVTLGATGASAATIVAGSPLGSTFSIGYSQAYTGPNDVTPVNLSAQSDWTLTGKTRTQWRFDVILSNLTSITTEGMNRLTSWGFNTTPDTIKAEETFQAAWDIAKGTVPSGLGKYEVCVVAGPNCSGGAGGGLAEDSNLKFSLVVTTASDTSSLTFDSFFVRYQSAGVNSAGSTAFTGGEIPVPAVPLPAAGFLLLTALGGLAALRRRTAAS